MEPNLALRAKLSRSALASEELRMQGSVEPPIEGSLPPWSAVPGSVETRTERYLWSVVPEI